MLPITKQFWIIILCVVFCAHWSFSQQNDECFDAQIVPVSYDPCNLSYVHGSNDGATDSRPFSGEPSAACFNTYYGGDVWYQVNGIPSSGNLLIKIDADAPLDLVVEAYYGSCENQLVPVGCTDFQKESFLLLTDLPAGAPLYIRVWDNKNDAIGRFKLAVQWVPQNLKMLELCDEFGGKYPANQFIVYFNENAGESEYSELEQFLVDNWDFVDMKECDCGPEYMQLWVIDESEIALLDDARKGSRQKAGVDTAEYNFTIEDYLTDDQSDYPEPREPNYRPDGVEMNVKVAIIDSGVDDEHSALQEALWKNEDDTGDCVAGAEIGYDFANDTPLPTDLDGHGTAVNGIFLLDYPSDIQLELMNLKFYEGVGYVFDAVCAMHFAMNKKADILNLSWGFYRKFVPYILDQALRRAYEEDILAVTSAGNDGLDNDYHIRWPSNAEYENIVTVGSAEVAPPDTTLVYYSNYGATTVDLVANGFFITLAPPNSTTMAAGTSLSAPFVARSASIMRAKYPELDATSIRLCLLKSVRQQSGLSGKVLTEGILHEPDALQCASELAEPLSTAAVRLTGTVIDDNAQLYWQYQSDGSIQHFDIQHSLDGKIWQTIGLVAANAERASYQYVDANPAVGQNYYRLQWTTEEGDEGESNVVTVTIQPQLRIYPNPVTGKELFLQVEKEQFLENAVLFNAAGREVRRWALSDAQKQYQLPLSDLPKGVYTLRLNTGKQFIHQRLVVLSQ